MRAIVIPFILVTLSTASCGTVHPTESGVSSRSIHTSNPKAQQNVPLPLTGKCEAAMEAPSPVSPGVIRQVDSGSCQLSHLGRVSFYSAKVINLSAGTQVTEATFVAADGDSIYVTGSGTNTPGSNGIVAFTTTLSFVSGTGRFERVAGEASITGEANLATRTSVLELEGTIAYEASDKRPH